MSPVRKFSAGNGFISPVPEYKTMLAGYGDYGALQRIAYTVASGSFGSFEFYGIPQTYQDLRLVFSIQKTTAAADMFFTLNGDFTANSGSRTIVYGDGASSISSRRTNDSVVYMPLLASSTTFATLTVDILNYKDSSNQKTVLWRLAQDLNGSGYTMLGVGRKNIGAVNSIILNGNSNNFTAGSTCELFGVKASAA